MRVSAIIPVYNNADTLAVVAEALLSHPWVADVIAVDDASRDDSPRILKRYKHIRVITHPRNLGKGAGIVDGWRTARHDTILTVDADLAKLSGRHLDHIFNEYMDGETEMVIAARATTFGLFHRLSGERIYRKQTVMPYADLAYSMGNGIEQIINHAHRGRKMKLIASDDIGHILKYERELPHIALWQYLKEGWQLARTEYYLRIYDRHVVN